MSELKILCPNCESEYSFPKFPQKCSKCGASIMFSQKKSENKQEKSK